MPHPEKLTAGWVESWEKLLAQNLPFKIFLKGRDLTYLACNENYAADHGIKPSEIFGRSDYDLYPRELAEKYRADDLRILQTGRSETIEESYVKDGQKFHVQTIKSLFRDQSDEVIGILGTFWDVSERKRAEEALYLSKQRLELAQRFAGAGIWDWDMTHQHLDWSRELYLLCGLDPDRVEVTFDTWHQVLHPDDREIASHRINQAIKDRTPLAHEYRVIHPDGQVRWIRELGNTIYDQSGQPLRMTGICIDISERKQAEEALRVSEREFRSLFDTAQVALFKTRISDSKLIEINQRYAQMAGYSNVEDCIAEFNPADAWANPNGRNNLLGILRENGSINDYETEIIRRDGTHIWILVSATIFPEQGFLEGSIVDITDRKRAQGLLQQERAMLNSIIDLNPYGIQIFDAEGHHVRANQAFFNMFQAVPPADYCLFDDPIADKAGFREAHLAVKEGITRVNPEVWYNAHWLYPELPDKLLCFRSTVFPIMNGEGKMEYFVVMFEDITERKRAEEALRESEEQFRTLVEMSPDGIFLEDLHGRILGCNPAGAEIYGYTQEELRGLTIRELVPEEFARTLPDPITEDTGGVYVEHLSRRKDGSFFPSEISTRFSTIGEQTYLLAQVRDITERKRAEEALRESEKRYRTLFDEALDGICLADVETGLIIDCNQALAAFVGRERAELIGQPQRILHPINNNQEAFSPTFRQHLTDKEGQILETQVVTRTGIIKEVEIKANLLNLQGRKTLQGAFHDITDRKRAEEALRESEEKYRRLIENSHDIIYTLTTDGVFTFVSPGWTALLGDPVDQVVGRPYQQFVHPDDQERCQAFLQRTIETGQRQTGVEYRVQHADRSWRWHTTNAVPLKDEAGTVVGGEGIASDITDRKRLEGEMDKTRADFLFGVSHELKTPLFLMDISLEMLENSPESGRAKRTQEFMETWKRNLHRLQHLVFNMVDSQRTQTMGFKVERQSTDFKALIERIVAEQELLAGPKKVRITMDLAPIPPLFIDPDAIHRLVENLLTNAIKFSPRSGEVTIRLTEEDAQAVLTVKDQGPGISAEEQKDLFLPFQRAATAVRSVIPGTGLGLYVAKIIVDAHDGTISLWSKVGKGTTVTVRLPLDVPEDKK